MNKFTLTQVTDSEFRIMCGEDTVGSISVEPNQVNDLLRCWNGPVAGSPKKVQSSNPFVSAMLKAKTRAMTRQAVLRGCL
jgi:hypothetical protein